MEPFIGQIMMFAGNFAPRGWALCDGQLLSIASKQTLFSMMGTIYGGNGETTFGLPDLRGRFPMHPGSGPGLTPHSLGEKSGTESHFEVPSHVHGVQIPASSAEGETGQPTNAYLAAGEFPALPYGPGADTALRPFNTAAAGGPAVSHLNPYQCINFIIALQGIFPSRN